MQPIGDPNLANLEAAASRLGPLLEELTLVGGCTTQLLITDPGAARVRPTLDVDLVVEATTYVQYEIFGKRLEQRGLRRSDVPGDPLCRWRADTLVIDVMPLDEKVLGFTNRWYASAVPSRMTHRLPSGIALHHIDAPHFVATKTEAFASRGGGDFVASHDLEDMVLVIDGRAGILDEIARSPRRLEVFVAEQITRCLADRFFVEAIPGYYSDQREGVIRASMAIERLRQILRNAQRDAGT